ncbi:hypothetical protein [Acanthamoeba castellanii mimivirus]|uniref:Uncharacterized protein L872 n=5 Tax=Mimivirus TaxID=315393 RepID=YL872_MIMIV|nr:hypothetical protein MIMI_gp0937 [Acanthamoeba polyphaga mimivirus]Q5UP40.1 RecName: Full=Uncharacterized protein L872 [Acanthamoeba polyphaga mimivirus]AHA44950.1 hypothetical protein HIRU_S44 [Hirudovirus strain Sangsue]AMK62082.1 hypothetical protein [Samba virus]AMZ03310.1 hypothetical protein [Mimivirus Bombay]BAV62012.1 hypothetical protein [Acanthamoeba castellanii mimivirus]AAV51130.1 unknown [Acanthamoeba polyphaga mimivirus]
MEYKLNKYIHKINTDPKSIYLNKIAKYYDSSIPIQVGGLRLNDFDSLVKFLKQAYDKAPTETSNKYLVILYGPPASGKSISRYIASYWIQELFKETESIENIYKSFIDTGIDEITYDIETPTGKRIIDLLKENIDNKLGNDKSIENAKKNISLLASSSWDIYRTNRPDYVSELLYYFAIFLNKNIFLETTGSSIPYLERIINLLSFYGYIPIVVYPFINDVSILYNRSIQRGLKEGRFLRCDTSFGLASQMQISLANYPKIKNIVSQYKNYLIYQYNSNFSNEITKNIYSFNFSSLGDYMLEFKCKIETIDDKITQNNIIDITSNNYDKALNLNLNCGEN